MPRRYRLGERAAQMDATRERIVEAAISLYSELGISATTMRQIGARADVAPGTLRSHFPSRELLEAAMVERLTAAAPLPGLDIFDGVTALEDRLRRLAQVAGAFLDGAARIYRMWLREPMLTGAWAAAGARYGAGWEALMAAALGPLAADPDATALLRAVLQPSFFDALRSGGKSTDEVSDRVAEIITPWLAARARTMAG
jgi:AcrR family transcriptional regulator